MVLVSAVEWHYKKKLQTCLGRCKFEDEVKECALTL